MESWHKGTKKSFCAGFRNKNQSDPKKHKVHRERSEPVKTKLNLHEIVQIVMMC